jgi:hypothetical protein
VHDGKYVSIFNILFYIAMMSREDSKRKINVIALRVILHKVSKMNGTATERVLFESKGVKDKQNTVHPSATAAPVCYITGDQ